MKNKNDKKLDEMIDEFTMNQLKDPDVSEKMVKNIVALNAIKEKRKNYRKECVIKIFSASIPIIATLATLLAYDIWNKRGLKFEETGSITSSTNRNLFSKMTPNN